MRGIIRPPATRVQVLDVPDSPPLIVLLLSRPFGNVSIGGSPCPLLGAGASPPASGTKGSFYLITLIRSHHVFRTKSKGESFHCSFQEIGRRPALALAEKESSLDFSLDKSGMTSGDSGGPGGLGYWAAGCCTRSRSAKL